jgi:anti-sigma B factor antagonist
MDQLQINRQDHETAVALAISGEMDVYVSPDLRQEVTGIIDSGRHLIIDLGAIDYLDSTGMGVLVGALKRAQSHDLMFILICNNSRIIKLFEITGLLKVFVFAESVDEALALLDPAASASPAP